MKSFMFLHPAILALFLLGMLPVASAYNDLVFFTGDSDNCDYHDAHVACSNWDDSRCCRSHDPFCSLGALWNTDRWTHTVYLTNSSDCVLFDEPQRNFDRCITASNCDCMTMPPERTTDRCSMYWHFGEPGHDRNNHLAHTPFAAKKDTEEEEECGEPVILAYTSHDGARRRISIPEGEFGQVMEMFTRRDFTALGRYETLEEVEE